MSKKEKTTNASRREHLPSTQLRSVTHQRRQRDVISPWRDGREAEPAQRAREPRDKVWKENVFDVSQLATAPHSRPHSEQKFAQRRALGYSLSLSLSFPIRHCGGEKYFERTLTPLRISLKPSSSAVCAWSTDGLRAGVKPEVRATERRRAAGGAEARAEVEARMAVALMEAVDAMREKGEERRLGRATRGGR
jgi:hypothetical protein